jgi:hypothetical protein
MRGLEYHYMVMVVVLYAGKGGRTLQDSLLRNGIEIEELIFTFNPISMIPVQTQIFRPPQYIGWIAMVFAVIYTAIVYSDHHPVPSERNIVILGYLVAIGLLLNQKVSVIIDNEGITHKNLLRQRTIKWDNICSADIEIRSEGHLAAYWILKEKNGAVFKMAPYGKKNIKILAEALYMKCDVSVLSNKVIKLAEGKKVSLFLD